MHLVRVSSTFAFVFVAFQRISSSIFLQANVFCLYLMPEQLVDSSHHHRQHHRRRRHHHHRLRIIVAVVVQSCRCYFAPMTSHNLHLLAGMANLLQLEAVGPVWMCRFQLSIIYGVYRSREVLGAHLSQHIRPS